MGFRFQKRITLFKGLSINFSKTGTSFSVGPRGAKLNVRGDKVTGTIGIPGTGLSYRKRLDNSDSTKEVELDNQSKNQPQSINPPQESVTKELTWKWFGLISFFAFLVMLYLYAKK